ncbi:MAG TPA: hypothetical protein VKB46_06630 [Pyrinomonadaceae bacterium]|nr:hypothetical protein [Pyrinomonadaceae bacterium]
MNRLNTIGLRVLLSCAVVLIFQYGSQVHAQSGELAGRSITGTVFFVGGARSARAPNAPRSTTFRLIINRLSTAEEVNQLNSALQSGQDQLLTALGRMNSGRIQIGSGVGVVANAIIASQEGDQTKVTVIYQRDVRFAELRYGARSADYRFGYAEMYIGSGSNQGMLIYAARIRLRDGTWSVEDFGTFPARLMGLRVR